MGTKLVQAEWKAKFIPIYLSFSEALPNLEGVSTQRSASRTQKQFFLILLRCYLSSAEGRRMFFSIFRRIISAFSSNSGNWKPKIELPLQNHQSNLIYLIREKTVPSRWFKRPTKGTFFILFRQNANCSKINDYICHIAILWSGDITEFQLT